MTETMALGAEILLLADPSPAFRLRVLTELLDAPETDPEVSDLRRRVWDDPVVMSVLEDRPRTLIHASYRLCRLAALGVGREHEPVADAAQRIFERQQEDGAFPLEESVGEGGRYTTAPLQTALPLRGLAVAGYATDPRAERAYDWLLTHRLPDGSWPTGMSDGRPGFVAGYRRLAGAQGCRATTTGALACFALHPGRATSDAARTALDLLLQRETREESTLGAEVARLAGVDPPAGFFTFYGRFDLAFILELASRMGASLEDARVADLVDHILSLRTESGLWEHPQYPDLSRFLSLELLLSLRRLNDGDWEGLSFRTPFRAYVKRSRRY